LINREEESEMAAGYGIAILIVAIGAMVAIRNMNCRK
jgi:hypothetical protein